GRSPVAGVGCCGAAVGGHAGVSRTVQELVAGAGDHRRSNVVHGYPPSSFSDLAASVGSLPGALDDIVTGAAARQQFVRAANGRSAVASAGCCGTAVGGHAGVSRTVQELVAGAGDHRGGNVVHGDGLNTFAEVAA